MAAQDSQKRKKNKVVSEDFGKSDILESKEVSSAESKLKKSDEDASKTSLNSPISTLKTPQNSSEKPTEQIRAKLPQREQNKPKKSVLEPADISLGEDEEIPRRGKKKVYVVGVVITILILGAVGGVFYFRIRESRKNLDNNLADSLESTISGEEEDKQAVPTVSEDDQSESEGLLVTEASGLERSEISLEVLNGTDVTGLAGRTADTFEELGYEIVEIGNAGDTIGNQLYVNLDFEGELGVLMEDVEEELGISSVSGVLADSDAHARIVLGE